MTEEERLAYVNDQVTLAHTLVPVAVGDEEDPCGEEQAVRDAAVSVAAQRLLTLQDTQQALSTQQNNYALALAVAVAADRVLTACRANNPV